MINHETSITMTATDSELAGALAVANLPTLLVVLAHLSGDRRWLEEPYRPSRTVGMNDNDDAGLSPERQEDVRQAALAVLRDWRDGKAPLPGPPGEEELLALLEVSLGEPVPPEFGPVMAHDAGFRPRAAAWSGPEAPPAADGFRAVIIGAGLSGLCAAVTLGRLGLAYTLVDKSPGVGGTWLDNNYPGAAVDTPSHLYSFSFAPNRSWSHYYARQPEILAYIERSARRLGVLDHCRFRTEVRSAHWDEEARQWSVTVDGPDGEETLTADVVISCVGQLNQPAVPAIPGLDRFAGPVFHSARWRHDVDLAGRRVAVVGTGASAMQLVPAIAGKAGHVTVFQRSPQWVIPNPNYLRAVDPRTRLLMEQVPYYATIYRLRLMHMFQDKLHPVLQKDPDWPHPERAVNGRNDQYRQVFVRHISDQVTDPALLAKVMPDYPPFGKRILMDNNWYRTLLRPDVTLVDQGVAAVDERAVITAGGERHEADVLVLATGFQSRRMLHPMDIRGRKGLSLRELWGEDDARAHLGITVPGFPNLFLCYGPNTNLGHGGSAVFNSECQATYAGRVIVAMLEEGLAAVEVRQDVHDEYNERVDAAHERMIWTHPGMSNWYRNAQGRVVTNSPWRSVDYWHMTDRADLADFVVTG